MDSSFQHRKGFYVSVENGHYFAHKYCFQQNLFGVLICISISFSLFQIPSLICDLSVATASLAEGGTVWDIVLEELIQLLSKLFSSAVCILTLYGPHLLSDLSIQNNFSTMKTIMFLRS